MNLVPGKAIGFNTVAQQHHSITPSSMLTSQQTALNIPAYRRFVFIQLGSEVFHEIV